MKFSIFYTIYLKILYYRSLYPSSSSGWVLMVIIFLKSKSMDFGFSNAVSDVFLRFLVHFLDIIYDHHENVQIWSFFRDDQFSNTVLGYKKGSKIKMDAGFRSATNKMWVVIFTTFSIKWSETLLPEHPRGGYKNPCFCNPPQDWLESIWQHISWSEALKMRRW